MGYEESLKNCIDAHEWARGRVQTVEVDETRALTPRDPAWWLGYSSNRARSGIAVTPLNAMKTSAVWACVRVLSWSMAAMPLHVYQELPNSGHKKAAQLPIYRILHREPNPWETSFTFRAVAMVHLCLYGNAYAEIEYDGFGKIRALWPIPPWCCKPMLTTQKGLFYQVTMPDTKEIKNIQDYRMLHVMGLGTDGFQGLSPIRQHMESIGISLAAEEFGAAFFGNGMNVGGVVEHPGELSDQGSENLRKSLNEKYAGLGNASRLMLLEEGMKYQKVGIPPDEAQFLETRQFQVEDVARMYNVQPHKIMHLLHATFSNIEHQGIEFVTDTILPWAVNFEQEYDRKLLPDGFYTKHSLEGLLRGDSAARATFYRELSYLGALSPDEIREKEDMNPEPDEIGKRYYVQQNMVPVDRVDDLINKNIAKQAATGRMPIESIKNYFEDPLKRIAIREKQNILRAASKYDEDSFRGWLDNFYRDFAEYAERQLETASDDASRSARYYIEESQMLLQDITPATAEEKLAGWEDKRMSPIILISEV